MATIRKNITQPEDHWAAFDRKRGEMSLSEWAGECMLAQLTKRERERLTARPRLGRPRNPVCDKCDKPIGVLDMMEDGDNGARVGDTVTNCVKCRP